MESWSYVSGVRNFVSVESVAGTDGIARIRNGFSGWGLKPSSGFGIGRSSLLSSDHDGEKIQELDDLGSHDNTMRNSLAGGSIRDVVSVKFGSGRIQSQLPAPLSSASGEKKSTSKLSSSIVESSSRDSSLIDLKLGRFPDHKDAHIKANANFSQSESSAPARKARAGNLNSQRPYCQVHGCRKDLSSSKNYHKRHKVCEIHSKTTKVIVNGIEQRFCQQCSRFHLLAEFDAGKRSCRKRLAGHNERRRKPHIGIHAGRAGRVYQSYSDNVGTRCEGTSAVLSSFVCQDILPSSLLLPERDEMNNWCKNLKVRDKADYGSEPAIPKPKGQTCSNCHLSSFGSDKQCSPLHDNGFNGMTRTDMNQKNHAFIHTISSSDFLSHPVFHNTTMGSEDFVLESSSVAQELPAASSYGCALSLLSSQSQNSSIHSSGIPTGVPLITPSCHAHYSITQVSEKLMVSSQTSTTGVSNPFRSSGINSGETQIEPILISDGSDSVNYEISGIIPGSECMNAKNQISCEDGSTIDLLQLSSQLHRVEHQRQSMKVEEENDAFFGLRIT